MTAEIENELKPFSSELLFSSSIWAIGGSLSSQFIRFAGNLILTRLLFPEIFGIMALMSTFMQGLEMFSDVGIAPSVVQNRRGDDPNFLRTAWTIQILRGLVIWLLACIITWPLSLIYQQPDILKLLPIVGFNAVISGFTSIGQFSLLRHLNLAKLAVLDITAQIGGLLFALIYALFYPTVWAFVFGGLVASIVRLVLSYIMIPSIKHFFQWERTSVTEIFHFGKWIFLSTIFTFFGSLGDKLVLGAFIEISELGIYSIASNLATQLLSLIQNLSNKIQFPHYSRLANQQKLSISKELLKTRTWICLLGLIPLSIFVAFGDHIIHFLYDKRYYSAGWIFQLLSFGAIGSLFATTLIPIFLATGNSYRHMMLMFYNATLLLLCLVLGGWYGGLFWSVVGISISAYLFYVVVYNSVKKYDIQPLKRDLFLFLTSFSIIAILWRISH